jgi:uncharacterized membrane protein YukC
MRRWVGIGLVVSGLLALLYVTYMPFQRIVNTKAAEIGAPTAPDGRNER